MLLVHVGVHALVHERLTIGRLLVGIELVGHVVVLVVREVGRVHLLLRHVLALSRLTVETSILAVLVATLVGAGRGDRR